MNRFIHIRGSLFEKRVECFFWVEVKSVLVFFILSVFGAVSFFRPAPPHWERRHRRRSRAGMGVPVLRQAGLVARLLSSTPLSETSIFPRYRLPGCGRNPPHPQWACRAAQRHFMARGSPRSSPCQGSPSRTKLRNSVSDGPVCGFLTDC